MQTFEEGSTQLVRLPKTHPFTGRTLTGILYAQVEMEKEANLRSGGVEDRYGWPHAFIVLVHVEWETGRGCLRLIGTF